MTRNYYVILGVAPQASLDEIRSAYRKRALELHPDQSGAGSEPFLAIQEAYRTLIDPAQRELYDYGQQLSSARQRSSEAEPLRVPSWSAEPMRAPRRHAQPISLTESFETYGPSFEELFDRFWSNFESVTRPKAEQIESLTVDIPLTRDQSRQGGQVRISIPARARCPNCRGRGLVGPYECWRCAGHGSITADYPLNVAYPAGIMDDYTAQLPLHDFGIDNFYLTIRFRITDEA